MPSGLKTGKLTLSNRASSVMSDIYRKHSFYTEAFRDHLASKSINPVRIMFDGTAVLWGHRIKPDLDLHQVHVLYEFFCSGCKNAECVPSVLREISKRPYVRETNLYNSGGYLASIVLMNNMRVTISSDDDGFIEFDEEAVRLFDALYDDDGLVDFSKVKRSGFLKLDWRGPIPANDMHDAEHYVAMTPFGCVVLVSRSHKGDHWALTTSPWGSIGSYSSIEKAFEETQSQWENVIGECLIDE
jgi:hypothetical protein